MPHRHFMMLGSRWLPLLSVVRSSPASRLLYLPCAVQVDVHDRGLQQQWQRIAAVSSSLSHGWLNMLFPRQRGSHATTALSLLKVQSTIKLRAARGCCHHAPVALKCICPDCTFSTFRIAQQHSYQLNHICAHAFSPNSCRLMFCRFNLLNQRQDVQFYLLGGVNATTGFASNLTLVSCMHPRNNLATALSRAQHCPCMVAEHVGSRRSHD